MTSSSPPPPDPEPDDGDEFYESLDRVLSSSNSSTSASDDDAAADPLRLHRQHSRRSSMYDVWISEPLSVNERRRRLRLQFGLDVAGSGEYDVASSPVSAGSKSEEPAEVGGVGFADLEVNANGGGGVDLVDGEAHLGECRIRNLDDGTEFILEQENVREVRTGRQLTLEEFERCVGKSPIVQELMRRQNTSDSDAASPASVSSPTVSSPKHSTAGSKPRKKSNGWLHSIRNIAGTFVANAAYYNRHSRGEDFKGKEKQEELEVRRMSSVDENENSPLRVRVRHYGKPYKELTGVFLTQEINAHNGAIWSVKFSLDGKFLASAGEDRAIHVWQVLEMEKRGIFGEGSGREFMGGNALLMGNQDESVGVELALGCIEGNSGERKRRLKVGSNKKSVGSDNMFVPKLIFGLSEKPLCSLLGHMGDVLDLSWSQSEHLLSSSMDKTVKLWDITTNACLKTFSHSDYVTCIQFNPVDDRFFISGSLDEKVRIWSIDDRHVVDWFDIHEMITAVCYYPDGQGALVGAHKGSCHSFITTDNKLQQRCRIVFSVKRKKSSRKITGFQFVPGSTSDFLVTSADSRIRVINGDEPIHKFKGFRNTSSQISASASSNGKYVVCASEDSHVYVWRYDENSHPTKSASSPGATSSYEYFHCQDVTAAVTWPHSKLFGSLSSSNSESRSIDQLKAGEGPAGSDLGSANHRSEALDLSPGSPSPKLSSDKPDGSFDSTEQSSLGARYIFEKLQRTSAWGLVMVTAGQGGDIKVFQNFGLPVHV